MNEPDYSLDTATLARAKELVERVQLYFAPHDDAVLVDIETLVLTRARPEGIAGAILKMAEAARGERERRAPIALRARADGRYVVVDGNSTVIIARAAGWSVLPAIIGAAAVN